MKEKKYRFIDPSRLYMKSRADSPTSKKSNSPLRSSAHQHMRSPPSPSLKQTKELHSQIMDYTDQVNPKTMMTIMVQEEKIKQKKLFHLITQLERTQQQLAKLDEKYRQQETIETHPQIREDVENLQKVELYKQSLVQKANQLNQLLDANNQHIHELQEEVFQKRILIRQLTKESWGLQGEKKVQRKKPRGIAASMEVFPKAQKPNSDVFLTETIPNSTNNLRSKNFYANFLPPLMLKTQKLHKLHSALYNQDSEHPLVKELITILAETKDIENKILEVKNDIARRCTNFNATNRLLLDSIQSTLKYFESKQKVVGQNGYADSLYFDISTVNASQSILEGSVLREGQSLQKNQGQKKQGANIKNILYEKLQNMMLQMIKEKQLNPVEVNQNQMDQILMDSMETSIKNQSGTVENLHVSLEQFLQFTPQQIIGILTLNPVLLQELVSVFSLKQKSLGLIGKKVRILTK